MIKMEMTSIDGAHITRQYKTAKGAREFARKWLGSSYDLGMTSGVSGDGISRVYCHGEGPFEGLSIRSLLDYREVIIEERHDAESGRNPYGSYEENCRMHALGMINMDDPRTW